MHINKRVKSRPKIQLPVEDLMQQYTDPAVSPFVTASIPQSAFPVWNSIHRSMLSFLSSLSESPSCIVYRLSCKHGIITLFMDC